MKNRLISLSLIFSCILSLFIFLPNFEAFGGTNTNCISAKNARSYLTSESLTLSADVYWNCSDAPMTGGVIYSISEDPFAYCTGPSYASKATTYTSTYAGVVECTMSTSNTSRYGANRSTLKIWSSYDFSTIYIAISHQAIPSKNQQPIDPLPKSSTSPTPISPIPKTTNEYPIPEPSDLQACTKGQGQPYWHCEKAPVWKYSVCASASKGFLQVYRKGKWKNIQSVSATYNPSSCGNYLPYSLRYYGIQNQTSGTYKYRFYFPEENDNRLITYSKLSVKVLYGGLEMDEE